MDKHSRKINIDKLIEIIFFGSGLCFIILVIFAQIVVMRNPSRLSGQLYQIVVQENDDISVENLCVIEKHIKFRGLTGIFNEYYLVLSNNMLVYVEKKDYKRYEISRYYNFELVERTTVSQWARISQNEK